MRAEASAAAAEDASRRVRKIPPEASGLLAFSLSRGRAHHGKDLFSADAALQHGLCVSGEAERAVARETDDAVKDIRAVIAAV